LKRILADNRVKMMRNILNNILINECKDS